LRAFGILRIRKIFGKQELLKTANHNDRKKGIVNADSEGEVIRFIGGDNTLDEAVLGRLRQLNIKYADGDCLGIEFMISASPEYFREKAEEGGTWDKEKAEDFKNVVKKWLLDKYGENMVHAVYHLDEQTPHIHAVMTPISGKYLQPYKYFGNKEQMVALQDSFIDEGVGILGIQRGLYGSKAKHKDIKEYYRLVNEKTQIKGLPEPKAFDLPETPGMMSSKNKIAEYGNTCAEIGAKAQKKLVSPLIEELYKKALLYDTAKERNKDISEFLEENGEKLRTVRDIPLEVLEGWRLEYEKNRKKERGKEAEIEK
jgi:hypothetical protein